MTLEQEKQPHNSVLSQFHATLQRTLSTNIKPLKRPRSKVSLKNLNFKFANKSTTNTSKPQQILKKYSEEPRLITEYDSQLGSKHNNNELKYRPESHLPESNSKVQGFVNRKLQSTIEFDAMIVNGFESTRLSSHKRHFLGSRPSPCLTLKLSLTPSLAKV